MTIGEEIPDTSELIEVHVTELRLIFNSIDPSPLRERDIDQKAERLSAMPIRITFKTASARGAKHESA